MKKIIALILLICIVAVAIYTCNDDNNDTSPNTSTSSESSKIASDENISDSSLVSSEDFSSNGNSSEADNNDSSVSSSDESDTESEITSIPDESEDISHTSSETSSSTSSDTSSETTSKPSHTCNFVKGKTVAPTCNEKGYTLYSCSCGKSEKRDHTSPLGHIKGDWETIKEATTSTTGLKQIKCTRCGTVLEEETIPKIVSEADKYNAPATAANAKLIEERVLHYINKYRNEEGVSSAQFLWDGKTYKYAKKRAEQIVDNFNHDREDIIEVCNELKFGYYHGAYSNSYIDSSGKTVYTGELCEPYYYGGCSEAITGPYSGNGYTVDYVAKYVASVIHGSSGHWNYVGAETTKYISIGSYVVSLGSDTGWYFCIATTDSTKFD